MQRRSLHGDAPHTTQRVARPTPPLSLSLAVGTWIRPRHRAPQPLSRARAQPLQSCLTPATPRTVACQAPLSVGFSGQESWSALTFPPPGDLPDPGTECRSPALTGGRALYLGSLVKRLRVERKHDWSQRKGQRGPQESGVRSHKLERLAASSWKTHSF